VLNRPIVGMAATPSGLGYGWWHPTAESLLRECPVPRSMGAQALNRPVVGIAATPWAGATDGASDGGIFSFGDAPSSARWAAGARPTDRRHGCPPVRPGLLFVAQDAASSPF